MVFVHGHDSDLNSMVYCANHKGATSNTGPILVFLWIRPIGCDTPSLVKVHSQQTAVLNCENCFYLWLGWELGLLRNFSLWLSNISGPNSFIQSCFKEISEGGRGDAYIFSNMPSPVSILTTFGVSWKCFMKNDRVRSCLIELQSFLQSKVDVDPIHRVLIVSFMLCACIVQLQCR